MDPIRIWDVKPIAVSLPGRIPKSAHGVSLAVIDPQNKKWYLFEATPDISKQIHLFNQLTNNQYPLMPDGIFITHAHIGHYSGLMQLGREVKIQKKFQYLVWNAFAILLKRMVRESVSKT